MKNKKGLLSIILMIFTLAACSSGLTETSALSEDDQVATNPEAVTAAEVQTQEGVSQIPTSTVLPEYDQEDLDASFNNLESTRIQLKGNSITTDGDDVIVEAGLITITTGGSYVISGTLNDGQVLIDTQDEETVRLILDGVDITSTTSAPINVRNAEKTIITLADGSDNIVSDGNAYILEDGDEPDAAIFSNDDMTINGSGSLTVFANNNNGIDSDDDLIIISGTILVTAVNDGIKGRDSLTVIDGFISINAGGDGMQANNDEDEGEGNIIIEDGEFHITADKDGIQAENALVVSGGTFDIITGGGSDEAGLEDLVIGDRWDQQNNNPEDFGISAKGLKAGVDLRISDGSYELDTLDDSIHSNGIIQINGGSFLISSGDDGFHADSNLEINGGTVDISTCYEGIESAVITINNGTINIAALDDGINAASEMDVEALEPGTGRPMNTGDNMIEINGGYIYVDSGGDGVDVNGDLMVNDGILLVNGGPSTVPDGAFDFVNFIINGGLVIGVGSAAMAEAPSQTSKQNALMINYSAVQAAGTIVHIESETGNEILTFSPVKNYQSLMISSPDLEAGETYLIYSGGSASGSDKDGLYDAGVYTGGDQIDSVMISGIITSVGEGGGFMNGGGGFAAGQGTGRMNPPGDMPGREAFALDEVAQLVAGLLLLEGTEDEISAAQAEILLPLWDTYLVAAEEISMDMDAVDTMLGNVESVLTESQRTFISSVDANDMMELIAQIDIEGSGSGGPSMPFDRRGVQSQGFLLLQVLVETLQDRIEE